MTSEERPRRLPRTAIVVLAVVLVVGAFTAYDVGVALSRETETATSGRISIEMRGTSYLPSVVSVPRPGPVTVTLTNLSPVTHTFTAPALGVDAVLAPGQTRTVRLTLDTPGTIGFFCRYHVALGMKGRLQVGG